METKKKQTFEKRFVLVLIVLALGSVGMLSARNVWSRHGGKPPEDAGLRFLCVGDVAVDLWPFDESDDVEKHLELPSARAKRECRPTVIPRLEGSETLTAAVAPSSGYGVVLERLDASPEAGFAKSKATLEQAGWSETAGSKLMRERKSDMLAAAYQHDGAWLLTLVVPRPKASGTLLLSAGFWPGHGEKPQ